MDLKPEQFKCYTVDDGGETHWFVAASAGWALVAYVEYMAGQGIEDDTDSFPDFSETNMERLRKDMIFNEDDGSQRPMGEVYDETVAECVKNNKRHAFLASTVY